MGEMLTADMTARGVGGGAIMLALLCVISGGCGCGSRDSRRGRGSHLLPSTEPDLEESTHGGARGQRTSPRKALGGKSKSQCAQTTSACADGVVDVGGDLD